MLLISVLLSRKSILKKMCLHLLWKLTNQRFVLKNSKSKNMERQLTHTPYFCLLFELRPCFLHTAKVKESLYGTLSSVIFQKCIDSEFVNRCVCLSTQNTPKNVIFICQYWRLYNTCEHLLVGSWVPSVNDSGFNFLSMNNFPLTNLLLFISISVPLNILNILLFQSTIY